MTIYKITNKVNGKVYIGKSSVSDGPRRLKDHISYANCNPNIRKALHLAIRKYGGESFSVETLHSKIRVSKRLDVLERRYIRCFKSNDGVHGYNMTEGGDGTHGYKLSLRTRKKMSLSRKGIQNFLGHHHTEEARLKIARASRDRIWSEATRKRLSLAMKGNQNGVGSQSTLGYHHTRSARLKISRALRQRTCSEITRKRLSIALMGNANRLGVKKRRKSR